MKWLIPCLILLSSLTSFAVDTNRSSEMVHFLSENKIFPAGNRQVQDATLICKISQYKKDTGVICVMASGLDIYRELSGEKAKHLSQIMLDFKVKPVGRNSLQQADIRCRRSKHNPRAGAACQVTPEYELTNL